MWVWCGAAAAVCSFNRWIGRKTLVKVMEAKYSKMLRDHIVKPPKDTKEKNEATYSDMANIELVGLHRFYYEYSHIEVSLDGDNLQKFLQSIGVLEEYLCTCEEQGGIVVQHLLTTLMTARNCVWGYSDEFSVVASPLIIRQVSEILDSEIRKAATSDLQWLVATDAAKRLLEVLHVGVVSHAKRYASA
jgi:hypothetical protein